MVKKSFLGRLFGKKDTDPKKTENPKGGAPKGGTTATATLSPKNLSPKKPTGNRVPEAKKENRFTGKDSVKPETKSTPVKTSETVKTESKPGNGNAIQAKPVKGSAVQPEILDETEKIAVESRAKIDSIAKKMSAQEEASVKISNGIKGLSSVLTNIDQRLEEQTQQSSELARTVKTIPEMMKDVPEASRAGIELLHSISKILDSQDKATQQLGDKISGLPGALDQLNTQITHDAVERNKEKKAIQESVEGMHSSISTLKEKNEALSKAQVDSTQKIVMSFKNVQTEHQQQIGALLQKSKSTNLLIIIMIIVLIVGVTVIAALL